MIWRNTFYVPYTLVNFYTFSKATLCSLSSNYFHKCWSVLYGGIVNGMNGCVCVLSMNNTLDECVREVMNDGQEYKTRASIPSTPSFTNDTFVDCTHSSAGGALYFNEYNTIDSVILRCTFENCSTTGSYPYGGAIYAVSIPSIQVINTTFTNCSSGGGGGGVYANQIKTCVSFRTCVFKDCETASYGGGIYFNVCRAATDGCLTGGNVTSEYVGVGSGVTVECSFTNCSVTKTVSSNGFGGGAVNWYNPPNGALFHSCLFKDCSAPRSGGAMNMNFINKPDTETILVSNSFFDGNNLILSTKYGYDVYLHGTAGKLSIKSFDNTFSSRNADNRIFCNTTCTAFSQDWLPHGQPPRYVDGSCEDTPGCGLSEDNACQTIAYVVGECKWSVAWKVILLSEDNILETKTIEVDTKEMTLEGKGNTITTVAMVDGEQSSLFLFSSGRLEVSSLDIVHNSSVESLLHIPLFTLTSSGTLILNQMSVSFGSEPSPTNAFTTGMIIISGGGSVEMNDVEWQGMHSTTSLIGCLNSGCVELFDCQFEDISLEDGAVIDGRGARGVMLKGCNVTNVKRRDGDGSVVRATVGKRCDVAVSDCIVDKCGVELEEEEEGDGGGMMVELSGTGAMNVTDSTIKNCFVSEWRGRGGGICLRVNEDSINAFQFRNTHFESNVAKSGKNVFLWAHDLSLSAQQSRFDIMFSDAEDELNGQGVVNFNERDENIVDLWIYEGPTVYVGSTGTKRALCGTDVNPCMTVDGAVTKLDGKAKHLFVVGGERVALEGKADMSGVELKSTEKGEKGVIIVTVVNPIEEEGEVRGEREGDEGEREGEQEAEGEGEGEQEEGGLVVNRDVFELIQIEFVLSGSIGYQSLIESGGTMLAMDGVSFVKSNGWSGVTEYPLLDVRKGMLEMTSVSVDGIDFDSPVFIIGSEVVKANVLYLLCSSLTLNEHTLLTFTEQSSVNTNNTTKLTISSSVFSSINSTSTTNGILSSSCLSIALANCSFAGCGSQSEQGSIVSFDSSPSVSITFSMFDGAPPQKDDPTSNTNKDDGVCSWNGSIVHFESVENVTLQESFISNSSNGGLSIIDSNVTITKGEFEGNNPMIGGYESARRNIHCKGKNGSSVLNIESLKGGDGLLPNTSLWILNEGCELIGLLTERASEFFIPTLKDVINTTYGTEYVFTLKGSLLLPCGLSFELSKVDEVGNTTLLTDCPQEVTVMSETAAIVDVEPSVVDEVDDEVVLTLHFGHSGTTEPYLIKGKKLTAVNTSAEPITRGSNTATHTDGWMVGLFAVMTVGLVAALISIIYLLSTRKKVKKEQIDTRKEDYMKDEEMKEDEYDGDNVVNVNRPETPPQAKKTMSQQRLLPYKGESSGSDGWTSGFTGDISDDKEKEMKSAGPMNTITISTTTSAIPPPQTAPIPVPAEKKEKEQEKKEKEKEKDDQPLPPSTSSLNSLVEGHSCHSPFELAIVDQRDSLFLGIYTKAKLFGKERTIDKEELERRDDEINKVVFWIANGLQHLIENGIGKRVLLTLNPKDVFYGPEGSFIIGMRPMGIAEEEREAERIHSLAPGVCKADTEMHRWMAPELLNGSVQEATEETLSFAVGMIVYFMLSYRVPFDDLLGADAGIKILEGWRPDTDPLRQSQYWPVMMACMDADKERRPTIVQLKRAFLGSDPTPSTNEGKTGTGDVETLTSAVEDGETVKETVKESVRETVREDRRVCEREGERKEERGDRKACKTISSQ